MEVPTNQPVEWNVSGVGTLHYSFVKLPFTEELYKDLTAFTSLSSFFVLESLQPSGARFLIVVPVTLLEQWRRELDTWVWARVAEFPSFQ